MTIAPARTRARSLSEEDLYPSSDGKPMGETDRHVELMHYCRAALIYHFRERPDIYIAGNNFLYFEQGNPQAVVSPDCYVVPGAPMRLRDTYMTWKEDGKLPSFVLEITSRKTRRDDIRKKLPLYRDVLRVAEYFLFDPDGDYLKPRLQGYRLINGQYELLLPTDDRILSEQLNLDLVFNGGQLRFYDPAHNRMLESYAEAMYRIQQESKRADDEAKRVNQEAQALDILRDQLTAEAQSRVLLEAELAQMRAALEALQKQTLEAALLRSAGNTPQDEQE